MAKYFPKLYDVLMKPLEATRFKKVRISLVRSAAGEVLEIGSGTGVNFPYYECAVHVSAIEPNPAMSVHGKGRKKSRVSRLPSLNLQLNRFLLRIIHLTQ